jgi:hypothetical protein
MVYPDEHEAVIDEELWNAVQAKLAGNRKKRRQARIESGAILSGLIFDDRGNRPYDASGESLSLLHQPSSIAREARWLSAPHRR